MVSKTWSGARSGGTAAASAVTPVSTSTLDQPSWPARARSVSGRSPTTHVGPGPSRWRMAARMGSWGFPATSAERPAAVRLWNLREQRQAFWNVRHSIVWAQCEPYAPGWLADAKGLLAQNGISFIG